MLAAHTSPTRSTTPWTLVSYPLVLLFIKDSPRTHLRFVKSCFLASLLSKVRNPRRFLTRVICNLERAHQELLSKQKLAFIVGYVSGGIPYPQQNSQQSKMLAKFQGRTHNPKKGNVCEGCLCAKWMEKNSYLWLW